MKIKVGILRGAFTFPKKYQCFVDLHFSFEFAGHVFKSLNTSGFIPKQGKMIADRIDGIW